MSRHPIPYSKIGMEVYWRVFHSLESRKFLDVYRKVRQFAPEYYVTPQILMEEYNKFEKELKKPLSFNKFMRYKDIYPEPAGGEERFTSNK